MMAALLHALHGHVPMDTQQEVAQAIDSATDDPEERAALVVISWYESRFGIGTYLVFGVIVCRNRPCSIETEALYAVHALREAQRVCHTTDWAVRLTRYNTGNCSSPNWYGRAAAQRRVQLAGHAEITGPIHIRQRTRAIRSRVSTAPRHQTRHHHRGVRVARTLRQARSGVSARQHHRHAPSRRRSITRQHRRSHPTRTRARR